MSMYPQANERRIELEYGTTEKSIFNFFNAVYAWMAVGLAVTAAVAWGVSQSPALLQTIHSGGRGFAIVILLSLFALSIAAQKVALQYSAGAGTALFMLYSVAVGVLISWIFVVYPMNTMIAAFFLTGGLFAVMSVYGYVTKRDLTSIGSFCVMGLIGLIIASVVNMFIASSVMSWVVTYGILLVSIGITAYQTQHLKEMAYQYEGNPQMLARIGVVGSLVLYITFINMFMSVLRILGSRR